MHPLSQWLFVIPDTDAKDDVNALSELATLLFEGDNVSFIYNATRDDAVNCEVGTYILYVGTTYTIGTIGRYISWVRRLDRHVSNIRYCEIRALNSFRYFLI